MPNGLITGHAYSITGFAQVTTSKFRISISGYSKGILVFGAVVLVVIVNQLVYSHEINSNVTDND